MATDARMYRRWIAAIVAILVQGLATNALRAESPDRYNLPPLPPAHEEYLAAAAAFLEPRYSGDPAPALPRLLHLPELQARGRMIYRTFLGGTVLITAGGPEPHMVCAMVHELVHHFDYYNDRLAQAECEDAERRAWRLQNRCLAERYDLPSEDAAAGIARSCAAWAKDGLF